MQHQHITPVTNDMRESGEQVPYLRIVRIVRKASCSAALTCCIASLKAIFTRGKKKSSSAGCSVSTYSLHYQVTGCACTVVYAPPRNPTPCPHSLARIPPHHHRQPTLSKCHVREHIAEQRRVNVPPRAHCYGGNRSPVTGFPPPLPGGLLVEFHPVHPIPPTRN